MIDSAAAESNWQLSADQIPVEKESVDVESEGSERSAAGQEEEEEEVSFSFLTF